MSDVSRVRIVTTGFEHPLEVVRGEDELPIPEGDQVVVAVEACGVCYRDLIDRAGRIPFIQTPIVPGHEAVGRVIATGPDAHELGVGDRVASMHRNACGECEACLAGHTSLCTTAAYVLGLLVDGGYAKHLVMPQSGLYRMPEDIPASGAAVLHCTFGSSWRALVTVGGLAKGERVLITGANGGLGSAAVQIAARFTDDVIAVVRDASHTDWLKSLGASRVIVDTDGSFHRQVSGVSIALECVGSPTFNACLRSLAVGGRLAVVGNVVEKRTELNVGYIVVHALKILGPGGATRADMEAVLAAHREKPFQVPIHKEFPLEAADEAQAMTLRGGLRGRVVVVPAWREG